ncbi:hypothetical protein PhAPEC5_0.1 [Escherichia phage vB_EcoP_PhAPEC5]|uniref:Uncharacterized protein n=1 Tax=Escherichia phage vB_EcoP_PhAPEC5 TaxID=1395983 RepID=A0A067Y072_9CAUD|nr:hypothetical protein LD33_gp01 [Escherichia phage vB_EcoP_PhAPEC5]AGV99280.1 hypothetical protein PhAPEC5_0.1 [Escherichia phage vB_EcoP_PhAPEC5]
MIFLHTNLVIAMFRSSGVAGATPLHSTKAEMLTWLSYIP